MTNTLVDTRTPSWANLGTKVRDAKNVSEVLKAARLDFTVEKKPLFVQDDGFFPMTGYNATIQSGTTKTFGIVTDNYQVCQNDKAFDFVDYVSDDLKFETAGITKGGVVYIIAKLPDVTILGDVFKPHLIFQNGFNGKVALKMAIVPLRIVCQNQFNIAFRESNNAISIKHTRSLDEELIQAKRMLSNTAQYLEVLNEKAEFYAGIKLSQLNLDKVFDFLFPYNDDMTKIQRDHLNIKKEEFIRIYNLDDNANFKGTAWGVINAMSDYMTHYTSKKTKNAEENKFVRVTFTPYLNKLTKVLETISA